MSNLGHIEFIKTTGEQFRIPARLIHFVGSRDLSDGSQQTYIEYCGFRVDVDGTYDEVSFELKKAGCPIIGRIYLSNDEIKPVSPSQK